MSVSTLADGPTLGADALPSRIAHHTAGLNQSISHRA